MGIDARGWFITKKVLTDEELSNLNNRFFNLCLNSFRRPDPNKKRESWERDGIPFKQVKAKESLYIIDFHLSRYYGIGYERGPFEQTVYVCCWLRRQPEVESVYYAGDYSFFEEAEEFTEQYERDIVEHYFKNGYGPYRNK